MSGSVELPPGSSVMQAGVQYGAAATDDEAGADANLLSTSPYQLQDGYMNVRPSHSNVTDDNDDDDDSSDDDSSDDDSSEEYEMSLSELLYSSSSYHAIAKPVTLTMTLAALSVVFINTEQSIEQGAAMMADAYTVWDVQPDSGNSTGKTLALSLANGLVMVSVICAMTFVIVFLYHLRCMKCLIGYMIFSSATLLGLLGGTMFQMAIDIYRIPIDKPSFFLGVYNFCIVGVGAIFWSKGIPPIVTQGYLVATSVILAWQVAHFDAWTTWTLLIMLALYDLCAVLTPCGPLRALVNLMSKEDSPEMPGLLYEAELPPEAKRPGVPSTSSASRDSRRQASSSSAAAANSFAGGGPAAPSPPATVTVPPPPGAQASHTGVAAAASGSQVSTEDTRKSGPVSVDGDDNEEEEEAPTIVMPLAIARVYNLPVIAYSPSLTASTPHSTRRSRRRRTSVSTSPLLEGEHPAPGSPTEDMMATAFVMPENPTPQELKADVKVRLPRVGGRIERVAQGRRYVYIERDRQGNAKRMLHVDGDGKVFAEQLDGDESAAAGGKRSNNSIRLGLGDFIFYSVMVAKAAMYSFTTFAACMLVILAGLGGTLVLLSVYHHALPALPISIFLGVIFYLLTRGVIEPWIQDVMYKPFYV